MRNANQFKGLAKGISKSTYPGSYTNHKEWTDSHTTKRFNDTMWRIRVLTLNIKEMKREEIIKMYEEQLAKAENGLEKSSINYEMKKHLKAYDNGEEYKVQIDKPIECIGCGS